MSKSQIEQSTNFMPSYDRIIHYYLSYLSYYIITINTYCITSKSLCMMRISFLRSGYVVRTTAVPIKLFATASA